MSYALPQFDRPLVESAALSYTLPSAWYTDPDVYDRERDEIFFKTWQYAAHDSSFTDVGDFVELVLFDRSIIVVQTSEGLRAWYNICGNGPHELLREGSDTSAGIVCHGCEQKYDDNGLAVDGPALQPLESVRLERFCNCVFINMDENATAMSVLVPDLEADIRTRLPYLDRLGSPRFSILGNTEIAAGWKVVVDNYVECYHCTPAHPDFASLINMNTYQVDTFDWWSRQLSDDIRTDNTAYQVADNVEQKQASFWFLWPNMTFNVLPGTEELSVFAIRPISIDRCSFAGHSLSVDGSINQARVDYTAAVLAPEDTALCESVQRGLHSLGYDQGRIIVDQQRSGIGEQGIHHFHRLVHRALAKRVAGGQHEHGNC